MEETPKETKGLTEWVGDHPAIVRVFLLALAALNPWISYTIYSQHPLIASLNAAMTAVLALGVILTW